jgi:hypothetical protein
LSKSIVCRAICVFFCDKAKLYIDVPTIMS